MHCTFTAIISMSDHAIDFRRSASERHEYEGRATVAQVVDLTMQLRRDSSMIVLIIQVMKVWGFMRDVLMQLCVCAP